ncbi:MAG: type I secretion system permease/ATPase [Mesorhizobium sp.]|uniref:type I secretion system permease/ATPase n=1 Tax=Mesorhizobium sp. TaxID=1871066 RepID=UPI00122929F1|nr:type I secretion system permease/ATPase [Mesorhizobium sp.]TIM26423.1 MAG: type I secretion system permease/ATPase [Mesorhizobium sp.]
MRQRSDLTLAFSACRRAFAPLILFTAGINVLMLTTALYMLQVYDRVLSSRSAETLLALTGIAALALVTIAVLEAVRAHILVAVGSWLGRRLAPVILRAAIIEQAGWQRQTGTGGLRDVEQLRAFLSGPAVHPLLDAPWAPIFLVFIFLMHPLLGLFALAGALILFVVALLAEFATRAPLARAAAAQRLGYQEAEVALRNAEVLHAMGMLEAFLERWQNPVAEASNAYECSGNRTGYLHALARFIRFGLQIGILALGALLVLAGDINPGVMVAASIIMGRALAPVEQAIGAIKAIDGARSAYRRLTALEGVMGPAPPRLPLPRPRGALRAEKVTILPPGATRPILDEISFQIGDGESLGIVGATASGKSSLVRTLVGAWTPTSGAVRLDHMDLGQWAAADRGQYIGYLPQDVELIGRTVAEAIARLEDVARKGVAEAIIAAAETAHVHELIKALPMGYETEIGSYLSGGQRQRIALARALYGDPSLVVLDEPNANLDREGEDALIATIGLLKSRGCTTVVVAHRPRILESIDYLLVLDKGRVELFGPRADVLTRMAAGVRAVTPLAHIAPANAIHGGVADLHQRS